MDKSVDIQGILGILVVVFIIIVNHYGLLYDALKSADPDYKGNHTISWKNGRLNFSLPGYINDKSSHRDIIKTKRSYNFSSILFWLISAGLIIAIIQE